MGTMSTLILQHIYDSTPSFTLDYSIYNLYFAKTIMYIFKHYDYYYH